MNKLNREITKSIKQIKADMVAKYQKLFKDLKKKGIVAIDDWSWNRPNWRDFKEFGADAKRYMESFRGNIVTKLNNYNVNELVGYPGVYDYVTADELKKFETVTYPKLYAEWLAEQKKERAAKREANAKNADKLRAKIVELQRQLDTLQEN